MQAQKYILFLAIATIEWENAQVAFADCVPLWHVLFCRLNDFIGWVAISCYALFDYR